MPAPAVTVSLYDQFETPRANWEVGVDEQLLDDVLTLVATDSDCVCPLFNFYTIMYPKGHTSFPNFVTRRLAGTSGSTLNKQKELEILSRYGIVKKMPFDLNFVPGQYNLWPDCVGQTILINNLPVGKNDDDLILSIENCITRRNSNRNDNGNPTYVVSKGKSVHDEFVLILQILRAKLIQNKL